VWSRVFTVLALAIALASASSAAQAVSSLERAPDPYVPPTRADRVDWVVGGNTAPLALAVVAVDSAWGTVDNSPREWHRGLAGFSRRFADEEATGVISMSIESGLGSLWGEDPRYARLGGRRAWARMGYAVRTVVLAPRPDGHLAPAWARLAAAGAGNLIENTWLPPSGKTAQETAWRVADGFAGRLLSNVWTEFWPDIRRRLPRAVVPPHRLR
jgi:hypothetical protein